MTDQPTLDFSPRPPPGYCDDKPNLASYAQRANLENALIVVKGRAMPDTARRYGLDGDKRVALAQKLTDPRINIKTGTRYLRDLINMFPGRLELALASYNAGEGAVQRAGNQIPNYKETQNYVKTVMQLYLVLKPPAPPTPLRHPLSRVRPAIKGGAVNRGNLPANPTPSPVQAQSP